MNDRQTKEWERQIVQVLKDQLDSQYIIPHRVLEMMARAATAVLQAADNEREKNGGNW